MMMFTFFSISIFFLSSPGGGSPVSGENKLIQSSNQISFCNSTSFSSPSGGIFKELHDFNILAILISITVIFISVFKSKLCSSPPLFLTLSNLSFFEKIAYLGFPTALLFFLMEVVWIGIPVVILFFIGMPTISLLYELEDSCESPKKFLWVWGYQWYWVYEFANKDLPHEESYNNNTPKKEEAFKISRSFFMFPIAISMSPVILPTGSDILLPSEMINGTCFNSDFADWLLVVLCFPVLGFFSFLAFCLYKSLVVGSLGMNSPWRPGPPIPPIRISSLPDHLKNPPPPRDYYMMNNMMVYPRNSPPATFPLDSYRTPKGSLLCVGGQFSEFYGNFIRLPNGLIITPSKRIFVPTGNYSLAGAQLIPEGSILNSNNSILLPTTGSHPHVLPPFLSYLGQNPTHRFASSIEDMSVMHGTPCRVVGSENIPHPVVENSHVSPSKRSRSSSPTQEVVVVENPSDSESTTSSTSGEYFTNNPPHINNDSSWTSTML